MSDTNCTDWYLYIPSDIRNFTITYIVFGIIFFIYGIIYTSLTIKTTCEEKDETQGQYNSQIVYIIAIFVKAVGLIVSGIFLEAKTPTCYDHDFFDRYFVLPGGLPGYMTGIAYCFIFFSWCSVCFDCLEKNTTQFYQRSKWVLMTAIGLIVVFFFIFFICMLAVDISTFHRIEQAFAICRDLLLAIMFALYLYKIYKLFEEPCPGCGQPESRLFLLCIVLIVSLILRPISILGYSLWTNPPGNSQKRSEFSSEYLAIYIIEFIVTEKVPFLTIGLTRLIGTWKSREPTDELSSFMALA